MFGSLTIQEAQVLQGGLARNDITGIEWDRMTVLRWRDAKVAVLGPWKTNHTGRVSPLATPLWRNEKAICHQGIILSSCPSSFIMPLYHGNSRSQVFLTRHTDVFLRNVDLTVSTFLNSAKPTLMADHWQYPATMKLGCQRFIPEP